MRHFRALHLVSQPPPELSHGKPKGLVSVGLRRACHHHTLLDQVFVNSDLHCTIPFVRTCRRYEQWSTAEVRSGKWRNAGEVDTENADETSNCYACSE